MHATFLLTLRGSMEILLSLGGEVEKDNQLPIRELELEGPLLALAWIHTN